MFIAPCCLFAALAAAGPTAPRPLSPGDLGSPLNGKWQDVLCRLLPPGISPFETVSDTLTFQPDGTFTQTIEKATGTFHSSGMYTVAGTRLSLSFPLGTHPVLYKLSRTGDRLRLQSVGPGGACAELKLSAPQ